MMDGARLRRRLTRRPHLPPSPCAPQLYNGVTKKLSLAKNVICSKCDGRVPRTGQPTTNRARAAGPPLAAADASLPPFPHTASRARSKGSKSGASGRCAGCQGQGVKIALRQIAPGMVQQMQVVCPDCRGAGQTISDKDRCPVCRGAKTVQDKKILEVCVERGMAHGSKIVFRGEADEAPDTVPGDIVFVVQQKEHAVFKRKGADLFFEKRLSLAEALCGFRFAVPHLDGRLLLVGSQEGDVVKPGAFKAVYDEGMPVHGNPTEKGRLFIQFDVAFPEKGDLLDAEIVQLAALLPPRPTLDIETLDACHEVSASDVDMEAELRRQRERQQEEEEEDPRGAGRVQCAQQ